MKLSAHFESDSVQDLEWQIVEFLGVGRLQQILGRVLKGPITNREKLDEAIKAQYEAIQRQPLKDYPL